MFLSQLCGVDSVSQWTLAGGQTVNACADVCLDNNETQCETLSALSEVLMDSRIQQK